MVDTGRDVGRLLFEVDLDQRVVGVESDLLVVVSDRANGVADRALDVEVGVGRDLTDDDAQSLGDRRLTRHPCVGILPEHPVQHCVRHLVADLVGMAFGN